MEPVPDTSSADLAGREAAEAALAALARPRLCCSPGARAVESELRRRFSELGYQIRELQFSFSAFPGRYGVSIVGGLVATAVVGCTAALLLGRPIAALWFLGGGAALTVALAALARPAIRWLPIQRMTTANWLVTRPGAEPEYVVVAHRDSKSQPSSLLLRATAAVGAPASCLALATMSALAVLQPAWYSPALALVAGTVGLGSAVVLIFCYAADRSPGALDNASGLTALLALAARERARDVALLVTDAEELGLAGATAACGCIPPRATVINLDGLDDDGEFHIMDRRAGKPPKAAGRVVAALLAAAHQLGFPVAHRPLPPGVLVDHIPFASAGFAAVTVMRGSLASLGRVHRPGDAVPRTRGWGAADAAALVSTALELLRAERQPRADSD